nr:dihydrofolate reductase [uncultured Duncaniella sp.]
MTDITIIVAATRDMAIGNRGDLLYHISDDLKRFKSLTMGHPIIMGRKTFESFPKGALPGRRNIVVTRNISYTAPGIETASSVDDAVKMCEGAERAFIIGGGEIYRQALPVADCIELTLIDADRKSVV